MLRKIIGNLFNNNSNFENSLLKKYGNCLTKKYRKINILFIADTHNCLESDVQTLNFIKEAKNYDCCILLGDHSANDLNVITKIVPNDKLYGVLGNHDSWNKYDEYSITDLNGKVVEINGVRIAGMSGSYKYKDSNEYAMYSHEDSIKIADSMGEADILVSHDKPFTEDRHNWAHDGLKGITEYIYKNHISTHIHGHLHEESQEILKNGTKSICLYMAKVIEVEI